MQNMQKQMKNIQSKQKQMKNKSSTCLCNLITWASKKQHTNKQTNKQNANYNEKRSKESQPITRICGAHTNVGCDDQADEIVDREDTKEKVLLPVEESTTDA